MPDVWDPNEKYWADEEKALRKRGIDPMQVEQLKPPKLPTHSGNVTLHRGKKAKQVKFNKGGTVPKVTGGMSYDLAQSIKKREIEEKKLTPWEPVVGDKLNRGKKPTTNYRKGGMVKGQCRDYSK